MKKALFFVLAVAAGWVAGTLLPFPGIHSVPVAPRPLPFSRLL